MKKETKEEILKRLFQGISTSLDDFDGWDDMFEQYHKERMVQEAPSAREEQTELQDFLRYVRLDHQTPYQLGWNKAVQYFNDKIFKVRYSSED